MMGLERIPKGKKLSRRPKEGRWKRIRGLRCHQEVYERLCAGYPAGDVARYVQDEQGEMLDVKRVSLLNMLSRYRDQDIAPVDKVSPLFPAMAVRATQKFNNRMEELERLEVVYEALLYRFNLAHAEERRAGKVGPDVDRQAKMLADLIAKMHEIKMDLGLTGSRDLGTLTVSAERMQEIKDRYGEGAARAFADPVQRAQVLGLIKRVMRLRGHGELPELGGVAVDAEDEDGEPVEAEIQGGTTWDDPVDDEDDAN